VKTLKGLLINLLAYAIVTTVVVLGLNLYVMLAERSAGQSLWQNYHTEFDQYFETNYGSLNPVLKFFKRGAAEDEFNKLFVNKYGKLPDKTPPLKTAQENKNKYRSLYFYLLTPLWIILTALVYVIKLRYFVVRLSVILIAAGWIIATIYLPALFGRELRPLNTAVLILVPAGIAWALIYLLEGKRTG
jgi:hypothetical protein